MLRTACSVSIVLLSLNAALAQPLDLGPLNNAYTGLVTFKVDQHQQLVLDLYDQGSRFRQDLVRPAYLDPEAITYSAEEDAIALKCLPSKAQCISKEIFKLDVVRATSRVTIPKPGDDPDGARTIAQLREIILQAQRSQDQAGAETPHERVRKNAR